MKSRLTRSNEEKDFARFENSMAAGVRKTQVSLRINGEAKDAAFARADFMFFKIFQLPQRLGDGGRRAANEPHRRFRSVATARIRDGDFRG